MFVPIGAPISGQLNDAVLTGLCGDGPLRCLGIADICEYAVP